MKFRKIVDSPCGLRYNFDNLKLQSGYSRNYLLDSDMMIDFNKIHQVYSVLKQYYTFITENSIVAEKLQYKLQQLKDIEGTISRLDSGAILDDIELFEIKALAILAIEISSILKPLCNSIDIPDLNPVADILDPEGNRIPSFYIYDSYSNQLKPIRERIKALEGKIGVTNELEDLLAESAMVERVVRNELSKKLKEFSGDIFNALTALAKIDIAIAKSIQIKELGLIIPEFTENENITLFKGLFHPYVKSLLEKENKVFQAIDIEYGEDITVIVGANMGGKSITLKSLALSQYLFQFGFGIPAISAKMCIKEEIELCIGDEQSDERGLSSFAGEMIRINSIISRAREGVKMAVFIDEPARTTNPTEGTALVTALIRVLKNLRSDLVITTHYNIESDNCRRLRVRGLIGGKMDYSLIEVKEGKVPQEALAIAKTLGIDQEWIDLAENEITLKK